MFRRTMINTNIRIKEAIGSVFLLRNPMVLLSTMLSAWPQIPNSASRSLSPSSGQMPMINTNIMATAIHGWRIISLRKEVQRACKKLCMSHLREDYRAKIVLRTFPSLIPKKNKEQRGKYSIVKELWKKCLCFCKLFYLSCSNDHF